MMHSELFVLVGDFLFHFPTAPTAKAARDWAALHAVDAETFRARYPEIPKTSCSAAASTIIISSEFVASKI